MRLGSVRLATTEARLGAAGADPNAPIDGIAADVVIMVRPDIDTVVVQPDISTIRVRA